MLSVDNVNDRWHKYRRLVPLDSEPTSAEAKAIRDEIILDHLTLVNNFSSKMARSMPSYIHCDDIESYAIMGLIRAISRYNPDLGVPFESYARTNMRSVVLDSIRALDWAPRSLRRQERELNKAKSDLLQELNREPTSKDIKEKLGLSAEDISNIERRSYHATLATLHQGADQIVQLAEPTNTEDYTFAKEIMLLIAKAVSKLPIREAVVVVLYYYQGKKLAEIAKCLGMSEVKVGALHSEAVTKIWRDIEDVRKT